MRSDHNHMGIVIVASLVGSFLFEWIGMYCPGEAHVRGRGEGTFPLPLEFEKQRKVFTEQLIAYYPHFLYNKENTEKKSFKKCQHNPPLVIPGHVP